MAGPATPGGRVAAAALVGRADELAQLAAAVAAPPAVVLLAGEAGVGKSRLVAELRDRVRPDGHAFLVGSCQAIREPFPLGPVLDAVRSQPPGWAPAGLSPVVGGLRPLLPELAEALPPAPDPLEDRVAERHRVLRGLVELLRALAPVTLVLEDLHWADEQTVDFLRYLRTDPPAGLSLVVTFRAEEVDPTVPALLTRLPAPVGRTRIALEPLDVAGTGELAAALAGVARVSDDFAGYLAERTGGLPFAIEEVMALLRERGQAGGWARRWSRRMLDELAVPAAIRDHVLARAALLPAAAQPVLAAAAVLHRPAPEDLVAAVADLPPGEVVAGASLAIGTGLLTDRADRIGFRHALAAQAVYDALPGPRRRELHDRAAAAIRVRGPDGLGQVAYHLRRAGRIDEWAATAEQAADQAMEYGHDDEAVRLLEDVVRHTTGGTTRRGEVAVKLGRAAMMALHASEDVVDLLSQALAADLPAPVRGELRLRLAQLLERFGTEVSRQRELLAAAIEDLPDRPELMASGMLALGFPVVPGRAAAEHRGWLQRVLETLPRIEDREFRVFLLGKVAMVQLATGDPQWAELRQRVVDLAGVPRRPREVNAYYSIGFEACYAGHLPVAERLLAGAREGAVACHHGQLEVRIRSALTLLDYCRGAWSQLAGRVERLIGQLDDHAPSRADAEVVAGCLALARGQLDRASGLLEPVTRRLAQRGGFDLLPLPATALIRLSAGRGDVARTRAVVDQFLAAAESVPFEVSSVRALPALCQAMVLDGRTDDARDLVARWAEQLAGLDAPLAPAALPHARGILAAAAGRWGEAADQFGLAADTFDRLGCPYEAAQAREQAAGVLLRSGPGQSGPRRPGGSPPAVGERAGAAALRGALQAYQRLGASWDLDRASHLARRHRISVPARHRGGRRGYGTGLSPRERQVAGLAAAGHTNKEIAAELFLSPETVKSQLQSAMRKLGARTRAGLSHQLLGPDRPRPAAEQL